jgi:limonene-1,2-epoxide hydrolase
MTKIELLTALFAAIDSKNADSFVDCLTADALFRFGSAPQVAGRDAIHEAVSGFFSSIAGVKHELRKTISDGDTLFCEGDVTYTRHDGSEITLPFVNVLEIESDMIADYKIYADIGPLYAG